LERQLVTKPGTPEANVNDYSSSSFSHKPRFPIRGLLHSEKNLNNHQSILRPPKLQAKLAVSQPGDPYEQEADRVAEQVMRMPDPVLQRKCTKCEKDEKTVLQAKNSYGGASLTQGQDVPSIVKDVLRSPGKPLDPATRAYMEPRFGYDFSHVRVHKDTKAADSVSAVNALAYTAGKDVVFGKGQYLPETNEGLKLIAHELMHVVQQSTKTSPLHIQRACGSVAIGDIPPDCNLESQSCPQGERFLFKINCDEFAPGEQTRLLNFAKTTSSETNLNILGLASMDGSFAFNEALACKRAKKAENVLTKGGVSLLRITSVKATVPPGSENDATMRSVAITTIIGPVKPPGSPSDFCIPYTSSSEASSEYSKVVKEWLTYAYIMFGSEVFDLWAKYLTRPKGASLTPILFNTPSSRIVKAFENDEETKKHCNQILDSIAVEVSGKPKTYLPVYGISGPFSLSSVLPPSDLKRSMSFKNPASKIPGNIAGGESGSDAGPDTRYVVGDFTISKILIYGNVNTFIRANLEFTVFDTIDFCPGAWGGMIAQRYTIPMSRLEATPWMPVYDLPFQVDFKAFCNRQL